jgi:hypothetical protein
MESPVWRTWQLKAILCLVTGSEQNAARPAYAAVPQPLYELTYACPTWTVASANDMMAHNKLCPRTVPNQEPDLRPAAGVARATPDTVTATCAVLIHSGWQRDDALLPEALFS